MRTNVIYLKILCYTLFIILSFGGFIVEEFSILSRPSYFIVYFIAFVLYFRLQKKRWLCRFLSLIIVFSFVMLLYYIFGKHVVYRVLGNVIVEVPLYSNVVKMFYFVSTFIIFYYLFSSDRISTKELKNLIILGYIFAVFSFFEFIISFNAARTYDTSSGELTNNTGYIFSFLLPSLYLLKSKLTQLFFLIISILFIFVCAKRGAIVMLLIFLIQYGYICYKQSGNKIRYLGAIFILVCIISSIVVHYYMSSSYLMGRVNETMEGNTSGRDEMYMTMLQYYFSFTSVTNIIFGYGIGSVIELLGEVAHNDWLEIICSYGLLGFTLYVFILISLFNISNKIKNKNFRLCLTCIIYMWIFKSLMSEVLFASSETFIMFLLLGVVCGSLNNKRYSNEHVFLEK